MYPDLYTSCVEPLQCSIVTSLCTYQFCGFNAPKTKRVGQKSLKICASLAVSTFNEGSTILAAVLADLGVQSPRTTLVHFVKRDKERNRCRIQAITESHKRRRHHLKAQLVAAEASRRKREKNTTYKSGAFGMETSSAVSKAIPESDSDTVCEECSLRVCPIGRSRKIDKWIGCECCTAWFHARCIQYNLKDLGDDPFICETCNERLESIT